MKERLQKLIASAGLCPPDGGGLDRCGACLRQRRGGVAG